MERTKGPWRLCGGMTPKYTGITSDRGYIVFEMGDYSQQENGKNVDAPPYLEQRANAEFIVKACNEYDGLKAEIDNLHRQLAAERLRADTAWQRYENANMGQKLAREELARLNASLSQQPTVYYDKAVGGFYIKADTIPAAHLAMKGRFEALIPHPTWKAACEDNGLLGEN